jgi:hypothetical protein
LEPEQWVSLLVQEKYQEEKACDKRKKKIITIQFSGCLLTCRLNSTSAYYKASTKTKIQHKNSTNTQKQNTKQTQKNMTEKNVNEVMGQKPYTLKKHR